MLKTLIIQHFKSYENIPSLQFSPSLNVIVGGNGQGKSNFIRALLFVFSDKMSLNQTQYSNTLHKGVTTDVKNSIQVVAELDVSRLKMPLFSQGGLTIGRKWLEGGGQSFYINGKPVQKGQLASTLECLGICYSNPYNIVQQGKINQVALMDEHQLYKLLEESTGVRRYLKKKEECQENLEKMRNEKKQVLDYLDKINRKIKTIGVQKREYEEVQRGDLHKKRDLLRQCVSQITRYQEEMEACRAMFREKTKVAATTANTRRALTQEAQALQSNVNILTQKLSLYKAEELILPQIMSQSQVGRNSLTIVQIKQEKKSLEQKIQNSKRNYQSQKEKLNQFKEEYQSLKIDKMLTNSKGREKLVESSIIEYDQEIASLNVVLKSYQKSLAEVNKHFESNRDNTRRTDIEPLRREYGSLAAKLKTAQANLQANKLEKILSNRRKNELFIQISSARQNFRRQELKFGNKVNHLVNFALTDEIAQRKVQGVYGYIMDFIQVQQDVAFAYDIAIKTKFFSLLVEDDSVAKQVIEINRQIKGKRVNIYTLNHIRSEATQVTRYPDYQYAFPLTNPQWIKVKNPPVSPFDFVPLLKKLINKSVCKYILVEEYSQALQISKMFHLNCITGKGEVVFADAVICRVGEMQVDAVSKLLSYSKITGMRKELGYLEREEKMVTKQADELENKEAQLLSEWKKVSADFKRAEDKFKEAEVTIKAFEALSKDKERLFETISQTCKEIQSRRQMKKRLEQKPTTHPVSNQQVEKAQKEFKYLSTQVTQTMQNLSTWNAKIQSMNQKISNLSRNLSQNTARDQESKFKESMADADAVKLLNNQISASNKQLLDNNLQITSANDQLRELQEQASRFEERMLGLQEIVKEINLKRTRLEADVQGADGEQQQLSQQSSTKSNSMIVFTARDKWLFMRHDQLKEEVSEHQSRLQYFDKSEGALLEYIKQCDQDATRVINQTMGQFEGNFKSILHRLEPNATSVVRLKKLSQRNDKNKLRNGLDLRVAFKLDGPSENLERKMRQLSGGQKTLVSVVFLMALQKCGPAPFYAFDQADAALDVVYSTRIAELFCQLSSESQYMVSTFKPILLELGSDSTQFLQVSARHGVSRIQPVKREDALQVIERDADQHTGEYNQESRPQRP